MPSRRRLLAAVGTVSTGSLAGCSLSNRVDGYVQLKVVLGVRTADGKLTEEDVWADRFERPRYPTVGDDLHDDLTGAYDEVRYIVGVCSTAWADEDEDIGCYNADTPRSDFNEAQVNDQVRASWTGDQVRIHEVDGDWSYEER